MPTETVTRNIFDGHGILSPLGGLGYAAVHQNSRWDFDDPRITFYYSLTYILDGRCHYTEPGGKSVIFSPGDLFFCFPGIPHRIDPLPGEQFSEFWITFEGPMFDLWRSTRLIDPNQFALRLEPIDYWFGRFEGLFANVRDDQVGQLMLIGSLQSLLAEAMSVQSRRVTDPDEIWLSQAKKRIEDVLRADKLDLETIASTMGMSYPNFRRKFAAVAGVPPGRYHTQILMQHICEWLTASHASNKMAAEWFGFCNVHHFSKRFKEVVGVSPSEFRSRVEVGSMTEPPSPSLQRRYPPHRPSDYPNGTIDK